MCLRTLVQFSVLAAWALAISAPMTVCAPHTFADEPEAKPSISDLRTTGLRALEKVDRTAASDAADRLLLDYENDPRAIRLAADLYLRSGKIHSSIKQFERFIERVPQEKPELWQFGIALALAERYEEGRKLFELHRTVNPNDVENAAWHFFCVAKLAGREQAEKLVLPAPGDTRVPMNEIRRLLMDGDEKRVIAAVAQLTEGSDGQKTAKFYADLYLGLYADAIGDNANARKYVNEAAKNAQINYMGDIARVYAAELEAEVKVETK
jgi:lipoprotein NlpI